MFILYHQKLTLHSSAFKTLCRLTLQARCNADFISQHLGARILVGVLGFKVVLRLRERAPVALRGGKDAEKRNLM